MDATVVSVKLTKPVAYRLCCIGDINKNRKRLKGRRVLWPEGEILQIYRIE